jgi:hypothetical protein
MLTGRWRGDDDRQPDADTCLQTLGAWAWDGAASNHPVSGVGMWTNDIPAKRVRLGEADADALDHVATPLGPPTSTPGLRCTGSSTGRSVSTSSPSMSPAFL